MKQPPQTVQEELLIDLTLHNFSADMLREFAVKIVKPYFGGNVNQALRSLMEKAIEEEAIVNQVLIS